MNVMTLKSLAEQALTLAYQLIKIPSVTGNEQEIADFLSETCSSRGWMVERITAEPGRDCVFVRFGTPRIVFTTHTDVVPAPAHLFVPNRSGDVLVGRGACDAKGILATMITTAQYLLETGNTNFGLLFVPGEEIDSVGALAAAQALKGAGIRYLVNGEPTEGKLMTAHKGVVVFRIDTEGKAYHSGYPERGIDANVPMIQILHDLLSASLPEDTSLGKTYINLGKMIGGMAGNIVSPHATTEGMVRTVTPSEIIVDHLASVVGDRGKLTIISTGDPVTLLTVPGFETEVAQFYTDIPAFLSLGAQPLLYGPGSIHTAHTDHEHITKADIEQAITGYITIFEALEQQ